jgi:hypothetical protein
MIRFSTIYTLFFFTADNLPFVFIPSKLFSTKLSPFTPTHLLAAR